jgi:hypothetical protein
LLGVSPFFSGNRSNQSEDQNEARGRHCWEERR